MIEIGPGAVLAEGRYRLERRLGTGGMASVWLATDERLGRPVAIKVIADTLAGDEEYTRRFEREARIAAGLSHPNLVGLFDYASEADRPFLVMEYVDGGTLADGPGTGEDAVDAEALANDLLDALAHVHEAGILHRDIKPANILIGRDGRPRISDFGIAQPDGGTRLTRAGNVVGTMRYLPPEALRGEDPGPRGDLYALGVLLGDHQGERPSPRLAALIDALTADAPEDRPASAREALALARGQAEETATTQLQTDDDATRSLTRSQERTQAIGAHPSERPAYRQESGRSPMVAALAEIGWRTWAALAAVLVLLLVAASLGSGGGGTTSSGGSLPPADAPLDRQLDALDRAVRDAGR